MHTLQQRGMCRASVGRSFGWNMIMTGCKRIHSKIIVCSDVALACIHLITYLFTCFFCN
eukprot:c6116_g1_i1 orf=1-174(-)